ncbi:MAG: hypothetical protein M9894_22250 [Planctomycetes bacterium]|nr:hypothetical protein [Planctomycetota bacterium]
MPWICCATTFSDDTFTCGTCGGAKATWTLRFQRTRVFQVGGAWIELELLDWDGAPVADEPYVLETPAGKLVEGRLGADGRARLEPIQRGQSKVWFPERDWVEGDLDLHKELDAWIEVELLDYDDGPVAGEPYRVTLPGGEVREGALDARGRARLDLIPAGTCVIEFPERDQTWFQEASRDGIDPRAELHWLAFELLDHAGAPVAGEPYRVTLPDGTVREGELDAQGRARLERLEPGTCTVELPARDQTWFQDAEGPDGKALEQDAWLELELLDGDGAPVPDEPYRVTLPGGEVREGRLDARGRARLGQVPPGTCAVEWPERDESQLEGGGGRAASKEAPEAAAWLELELLDAAGAPVAGERFAVTLPDGRRLEGTLDARGRARLAGVPEGTCQVEWPDRDASWFEGGEPPGAAGARPQGGAREELTWIALELLDGDGAAVADEPYALTLPDGTRREGRLDASGRAREEVPAGRCQVEWTARDAGDLEP